jgi:ribonuclease HII
MIVAIPPRPRRPGDGRRHPTLAYERELRRAGKHRIAGIDEVGRGALAGPVAAAAVVLPEQPLDWYDRVYDSKDMTAAAREEMVGPILRDTAVGFAMVSPDRVDSDGIVPATKRAMTQAVRALGSGIDALLIDALTLPGLRMRQVPLIEGDKRSLSIACAAIVAKVTRDKVMSRLHEQYPAYSFDQNKGYGTEAHREALGRVGPSAIHRRTFLSKLTEEETDTS